MHLVVKENKGRWKRRRVWKTSEGVGAWRSGWGRGGVGGGVEEWVGAWRSGWGRGGVGGGGYRQSGSELMNIKIDKDHTCCQIQQRLSWRCQLQAGKPLSAGKSRAIQEGLQQSICFEKAAVSISIKEIITMQMMRPLHLVLVPTLLIGMCYGQVTNEQVDEAIAKAVKVYQDQLAEIRTYFGNLARQVMLQQFNSEQRIRTDGYSGVKAVRGGPHGPRNYYSKSVLGSRFIAIHDHANYMRTVGMGEINAVINGVEFTTRHNDYKLVMPSTNSSDYHKTEPLPFPDVPPSVLAKKDVDDQIQEMRAYFKAFATQNTTIRDYRPYFKANMCYMEGAWTLDKSIEEPFHSERHQLDAASWLQLQSLIRYGAYTGTKSPEENFAHLPTAIMFVNKTTGAPSFAQWNYRILCSPIEEDIPLSYIKQMPDLQYTVPHGRVGASNRNLRVARFVLYEHEQNSYHKYGLLDRIFYNITGKDNMPSSLRQESYGKTLYVPGSRDLQDTSRYARSTELGGTDAMGNRFVARGFNDPNLFCAETTQPRVAPITLERCKTQGRGWRKTEVCQTIETRFSWAIPLEIVYLTPLSSWNPYKIHLFQNRRETTDNGKLGGGSVEKALRGADNSRYYITPTEFYRGRLGSVDKADTARGGVWVRDHQNVSRRCSAAGQRILTPDIEGVGRVRLRYPIAPLHGEGSAVWKELNALSDYFMAKTFSKEEKTKLINFRMTATTKTPPGEHDHEFALSVFDFKKIRDEGQTRTVMTSQDQGHSHELVVRYARGRFEYKTCSGFRLCRDDHPRELIPDPDDVALNIDSS
ncbi:hypothetical protein RRG08_009332 [Elysia crispata]|uniref:Uncharacterized protein n=1 Tax=Elysia crispata TaxID=231223 RepID=A0AAE0Y9Q9_9GAST|nr:hypothetical protein RRG08_009332 [Elysia crispata]